MENVAECGLQIPCEANHNCCWQHSSGEHRFFQTSRSHLKILGATIQNLVALVTWRSGFVHRWYCLKFREL